jgi:hypothetical protein
MPGTRERSDPLLYADTIRLIRSIGLIVFNILSKALRERVKTDAGTPAGAPVPLAFFRTSPYR